MSIDKSLIRKAKAFSIKNGYVNSGELSKEFTELYPEKTKGMLKAGVITKKEVKAAKNVWKDLPGISNVHKTE